MNYENFKIKPDWPCKKKSPFDREWFGGFIIIVLNLDNKGKRNKQWIWIYTCIEYEIQNT